MNASQRRDRRGQAVVEDVRRWGDVWGQTIRFEAAAAAA